MKRNDILNKIIKEVSEDGNAYVYTYNKVKYDENTIFIDDLGWDSLDELEGIFILEIIFDIEITDEEAEKFKTIGDVVNYIEQRMDKQ